MRPVGYAVEHCLAQRTPQSNRARSGEQKWAAAYDAFSHALRINANDKRATIEVAELLLLTGRASEGERNAHMVLNKGKPDIEIEILLARAPFAQNKATQV